MTSPVKMLLFAALMLTVCSGYAQPYIDLLNFQYYSLPEKTDLVKENEDVSVSWTKVSMNVPVKIKEDFLLIEPLYEKYTFDGISASSSLYGMTFSMTYLKQ